MPTLFIVATPIGNLEDITLRALRVLKEVDFLYIPRGLPRGYQVEEKIIPSVVEGLPSYPAACRRVVDLILAEDTRVTQKLLRQYEIKKPVLRYDEHVAERTHARVVSELEKGKSIVLVSDAGTPGISDPGARLVAYAQEHAPQVSYCADSRAVRAYYGALCGRNFCE